MDLQFFIETIKSGLAFGFMQIVAIGSVKEISSRLKSIFKGQSLIEKEYDRIRQNALLTRFAGFSIIKIFTLMRDFTIMVEECNCILRKYRRRYG